MNDKKRIARSGGMTLVEVMAAMSIIAVCAAMLWTGYRATLAVMRRSADSSRDANAAFALTQSGADTSAGAVSFRANGRMYTVDGVFTRGADADVVFRAFRPLGGAP